MESTDPAAAVLAADGSVAVQLQPAVELQPVAAAAAAVQPVTAAAAAAPEQPEAAIVSEDVFQELGAAAEDLEAGEHLNASQKWENYLHLRKEHWPKVPDVFIKYENLGYQVEIPKVALEVPNLVSALHAAATRPFAPKGSLVKPLKVLSPVSGCIVPGSMTLVLSEPGGGKSTLLKLLAGQAPDPKSQLGRVLFNGHTQEELDAMPNGLKVPRAVAYVDQEDRHMSMLTVRETLKFAQEIQAVDTGLIGHPELIQQQLRKVEQIIELLGLDECAETILGNNIVRGVSGGQKKRVSIAETLMGEARALALDEPTNGLDSAVAFDILNSLRLWCKVLNSSVVTALLQPTPEVYELFDDLILLRGGKVLYHGPRAEVPNFMASIGVPIPDTMDEADFLTEFLCNSQYVAEKYGRQPGAAAADDDEAKADQGHHQVPDITSATLQGVFHASATHKLFMERAEAPRDDPVDMGALSEYARQQYGQRYTTGTGQQFKLLIKREFTVMKRDKTSVIPRLFQAIFMGLVIGSLFWDLGEDAVYTRLALTLYSCVNVSFGVMVELPSIMESKACLIKHNMASMVRVNAFVGAVDMSQVFVRVLETFLQGSWVYWVCNYAPSGSRFVIWLLALLSVNFGMSGFFRYISSIVPTQAMAQLFAGPSVMVFFIFGGFTISRDTMAKPFLPFYWLSPIAWGIRGLSINEFGDARYDDIVMVGGEPKREGDYYLESMDFLTESYWIPIGIIVLFTYWAVFTWLSARALQKARHHQPGTQRLTVTQEDPDDELEFYRIRRSPNHNNQGGQPGQFNQSSVAAQIGFRPVNLVWRNLRYTVPIDNGKSSKVLLRGVSGFCAPGTLTAMLGSSGAGKSTLMDVIAGRKTGGSSTGDIFVNGKPKDSRTFGRIAGYVEQQDIHNGTSTVREALAFAANLRLPGTVPPEVRMAMVKEVMELLELTEIQDRIVGDDNIVGLAPGEKKRLTIGVEMVANPAVLFLDEPTTGLDSRSALEVIRVVRRIAATGRSVLCTVHQPSAELFSHFDRLLLLGTGGRQAFFGSNAGVRPYFEAIPGVEPCGKQNPATWILDVVGNTAESPEKASETFNDWYERSDLIQMNEEALDRLAGERPAALGPKQMMEGDADSDHVRRYATGIWTQFMLLQLRNTRSLFRNVQFSLSRQLVLLFNGLLFGFVYWDVGSDLTSFAAVNSILGLIFTSATFGSMIFCSTSLPVLFESRAVFYRETSTNTYSKWIYGPSLVLQDLPYVLLGSLIYVLPIYWLAGLDSSADSFLTYLLAQVVIICCFAYLGQVLSASMPDLVKAGLIQSVVMSLSNLLGGLFIYYHQIPRGWIWVYWINPIAHVVRGMILSQFYCEGPDCPTMEVPNEGAVHITEWVSYNFHIKLDEYWHQMGYLAIICVGFLFIVMLSLRFMNHIKR